MRIPDRNPCPENTLRALFDTSREDPDLGERELDRLLKAHPSDSRLLFLKGSLQAQRGDYRGARSSMRHAVDASPGFAIARFQLGFLELTSGEAIAAQESWGPLYGLPEDHFLRLFVTGLSHLVRDEFGDAIRYLEQGMEQNREIPPTNRDMRLIVDEIRKRSVETGDRVISSVGLLLQQSSLKPRRH